MQEKEINKAKKELANLYLLLKIRKKEDVKYNFINYKKIQDNNISNTNNKNEELKDLIQKPLKDLIGYVKSSIDVIISIKLEEELEKYKFDKDSHSSVNDYELLLQKLEQNIREHISIEHQLKLQCEKYAETLDTLEDEKIILLSQLVRNYF